MSGKETTAGVPAVLSGVKGQGSASYSTPILANQVAMELTL